MPATSTAIRRRQNPRAVVRGSACYLSEQRIVIARAGDVSLTGMFVQTTDPDPVGTLAQVRLVRGEGDGCDYGRGRPRFVSFGAERRSGYGFTFSESPQRSQAIFGVVRGG